MNNKDKFLNGQSFYISGGTRHFWRFVNPKLQYKKSENCVMWHDSGIEILSLENELYIRTPTICDNNLYHHIDYDSLEFDPIDWEDSSHTDIDGDQLKLIDFDCDYYIEITRIEFDYHGVRYYLNVSEKEANILLCDAMTELEISEVPNYVTEDPYPMIDGYYIKEKDHERIINWYESELPEKLIELIS